MDAPDPASELELLQVCLSGSENAALPRPQHMCYIGQAYAPSLPPQLLRVLIAAFTDLRRLVEQVRRQFGALCYA